MKINLALKAGARFLVNLSVDLQSYCESYAALCHSKEHVAQLKEANITDEFEATKNELNEITATFSKLRNDCCDHLTHFSGDMVWVDIKGLLKTQCCLTDPIEKELYSSLSQNREDGSVPLVIECLNKSFIELLKNSIDAILVRYAKDNSTTTLLQMEISLSVVDKMISVVIKDNAGGFSEDYLANFSKITCLQPNNRAKTTQSKLDFDDYCFGGHGLGHIELAKFILQGELLLGKSEYRTAYIVKEGATEFRICNNAETKGAEITLRTPMAPFPCFVASTLTAHRSSGFFVLKDFAAVSPSMANLSISAEKKNAAARGRLFSSAGVSKLSLTSRSDGEDSDSDSLSDSPVFRKKRRDAVASERTIVLTNSKSFC